jgi:hypothetical protein
MVREEKSSLWRMKQLLTKFRGDEDWAPCGVMVTEKDSAYFEPSQIAAQHAALGNKDSNDQSNSTTTEGEVENTLAVPTLVNGNTTDSMTEDTPGSGPPDSDVIGQPNLENVETETNEGIDVGEAPKGQKAGAGPISKPKKGEIEGLGIKTEDGTSIIEPPRVRSASEATTERATDEPDLKATDIDKSSEKDAVHTSTEAAKSQEEKPDLPIESTPNATAEETSQAQEDSIDEEENASESQPAPHRMTTRAQAQAASDNTTTTEHTRSHSPASSSSHWVHPLFLAPESARPNRDYGLQPVEAEDIRRLLLSYVQKQEEVCRNAEKLYDGLLRADRLRTTVLKWTKAEGHVGEMSDGEDWYDKEEWGLDEDLKKGHEEDEDDGNQGKKTRVRRG